MKKWLKDYGEAAKLGDVEAIRKMMEKKEISKKLNEILNRNWLDLKKLQGVLSVRVSTKFVGGKDTGRPCLTVFVTKKLPLKKLKKAERVPSTIEGIETDVVEFAPDWKIGETGVSKMSPEEQRKRAGGVRK